MIICRSDNGLWNKHSILIEETWNEIPCDVIVSETFRWCKGKRRKKKKKKRKMRGDCILKSVIFEIIQIKLNGKDISHKNEYCRR